jgi:hypothetical protein
VRGSNEAHALTDARSLALVQLQAMRAQGRACLDISLALARESYDRLARAGDGAPADTSSPELGSRASCRLISAIILTSPAPREDGQLYRCTILHRSSCSRYSQRQVP